MIFGGKEDLNIPIGELKQAFPIEQEIFNRSVEGLSVTNAVDIYDKCVLPLAPETVLIHIGEADIKLFENDSAAFDNKYRELIAHIRTGNKDCRIVAVSLKNYADNPLISEINRHLTYLADSERCEYCDISVKKLWNPKSTKDAISFVYSTGFVHPLKSKRPIYDLVKILFCCDA
ncbi:MAG: hypothetical protein ACI3XQ_12820 [Eubacteriales bacterium]